MLEELVEEIEDFRDFIWFSCCYIRSKSVHRADLGLYFEAGQISNSEDALCDAVQSIWGQKSTLHYNIGEKIYIALHCVELQFSLHLSPKCILLNGETVQC